MSNSYNERKVFIKGVGQPIGQESAAYENFYVASPEVYGVNIEFVFSKRSITT